MSSQMMDCMHVLTTAPPFPHRYVKLEDNLRVVCGGPVEAWLLQIETSMCTQLAKDLYKSWVDIKKSKREKWISTWAGQLSICTGQIVWTTECTKALMTMSEGGGKAPMKSVKKKQVSALNKLCDMVRGNLGKLDRKKVVNIITVEVHSRDVIDRMVKSGCSSVNDFEWLLQLRFYWEEGTSDGLCWPRMASDDLGWPLLASDDL